MTTDAEYRSRWDAETLMEAERIKNDPNRLNQAQTQAAKMAEDKKEEAKSMSKVAGKKRPPAGAPKGNGNIHSATTDKAIPSAVAGIPSTAGFGGFKKII